MTDAHIADALDTLSLIVDAWTTALADDLDLAPAGIDYQPRSRSTTTPTERLGPLTIDATTGDVQTSRLHTAHRASLRSMTIAHQHLQRAYGPLPRSIIHGVRQGLRIALQRHRTWPQDIHTTAAVELITQALKDMPARTWRHAPAGHHPTPDLKRCTGGPARRHGCPNWIPWTSTSPLCPTCEQRTHALIDEHPGHRGDPCRNPWNRTMCRGLIEVPKRSLCRSCDQFRRNALREHAA